MGTWEQTWGCGGAFIYIGVWSEHKTKQRHMPRYHAAKQPWTHASATTESGNNGANRAEEAATANTERTDTNARNARTWANLHPYANTA